MCLTEPEDTYFVNRKNTYLKHRALKKRLEKLKVFLTS